MKEETFQGIAAGLDDAIAYARGDAVQAKEADDSMIAQVKELRDSAMEMVVSAYRERIEEAQRYEWHDVASRLHRQMMVDIERTCAPFNRVIARHLMRQPIVVRIKAGKLVPDISHSPLDRLLEMNMVRN